MTIQQAHHETGVPEGTLRDWCRKGLIRAKKNGPRKWDIPVNFIRRHKEYGWGRPRGEA